MKGFPEFKNLVQVTAERASGKGDADVMAFLAEDGSQEGSLTFSGLDNDARKIAAGLVERGLSGRNLMLLYAPGLDYIRAFLVVCTLGVFLFPLILPWKALPLTSMQRLLQYLEDALLELEQLLGVSSPSPKNKRRVKSKPLTGKVI